MKPEEIPNSLKPGIYLDIEDDFVRYFDNPAFSNSDAKNLLISPAIYWRHSNLNPKKTEQGQTDPMRFGNAHHCLMLTPEIFRTRYLVQPGDKYMRNDRRKVVNRIDYDNMKAAIEVIRADAIAGRFVHKDYGYPEVTVIWPCPRTGILCKSKHDFFSWNCSVDFKSAKEVSDGFLINSCRRLRYPMQHYHYLESRMIIRQLIKKGEADFYGDFSDEFINRFLAVEEEDMFWFLFQMKDSPYAGRMWFLKEEDVHFHGERPMVQARTLFKQQFELHGLKPWPNAPIRCESVSLSYGPESLN